VPEIPGSSQGLDIKEEVRIVILKKIEDGKKLIIKIEGEITAVNAPELSEIVDSVIDNTDNLIFDVSDMEYSSSAGLRIFLKALQIMDEKDGDTKVIGANDMVMEIFEETGFINFLNIEAAD
jgi:anti-sigma B factor antagonist